MKTISILKTLINIYYYLMIFAFVAGLVSVPLLLFTNQSYEINLFDHQVDIGMLSTSKSIFIVVVLAFVLYFYFRVIQLIRNTVKELHLGHYFSDEVITNFKKIGRFLLISGFGFFVFDFILELTLESRLQLGLNSSLFIFVITGLFFLFLGEIFKVAKGAKEENDLTI